MGWILPGLRQRETPRHNRYGAPNPTSTQRAESDQPDPSPGRDAVVASVAQKIDHNVWEIYWLMLQPNTNPTQIIYFADRTPADILLDTYVGWHMKGGIWWQGEKE